jgi:hypothetical protein
MSVLTIMLVVIQSIKGGVWMVTVISLVSVLVVIPVQLEMANHVTSLPLIVLKILVRMVALARMTLQ